MDERCQHNMDKAPYASRWPEQMEVLLQSLQSIFTANETFGNFHFHVQHLELDLSFSSTENPWQSFFTCILQQVLRQPRCSNLDTIVQQAGKSWPKLQIKMNEIIRCSSEVFGKRITFEDISKTVKNQSLGLWNYVDDFLEFVLETFKTDVKLSFFDWKNGTIHHFYSSDSGNSRKEHVIIVHDPEINCFRLVTPRLEPDSSIDEYFEGLFNQMIGRQEMLPYLTSQFEQLETPEFHEWTESQFKKLEKVKSILGFPKIMLPKYEEIVPYSNFTLLARHCGSIQPSTEEEVLSEMKSQYIHTVECASTSILKRKIAQQKDNILRSIEKEKKLLTENSQVQEKYKEIEEKKLLQEPEIEKYRQNLAKDERTKREQEKLIRQKEEDIASAEEELKGKRHRLAWNSFRKDLMETHLSFETIKQVSQVDLTASRTLQQICETILHHLPLPSFENGATERENLMCYASKNDSPENRSKVSDIISFLFQPPKLSPNVDNKDILEVTGRYLIVSEVLKKISKYSFKELRLVPGLTIFLDADLDQSRFHGISVAMSAPAIEVIGIVTINTSGNHGVPERKPPKAPDGRNPGINGTDGEDGTAGESAGHVCIQASTWKLSRNLTIIANGGDGGYGQDGGDGADGDEGRDGADGDADTNWKKQPDRNKYIDRGTKGHRGGKGGDGGRAGLGAGGGQEGIVVTSEDFYGKVFNHDGSQGSDGKPGAGGKAGPGGYDGTDHGCAWHNFSIAFGKWRYERGQLDVRKQDVWYGGNGWDLIIQKNENEVRTCQGSSGEDGTTGKKASSRANQRAISSSRKQILQSEIVSLSRTVRSMYTHRDLSNLAKETASLKADQEQETRKSNLQNLKANAKKARDDIDAKISESRQKVHLAEESKTNLESQLARNLRQQNGIRQNLQKIASEKERYNAIIDGATSDANALAMLFQKQLKLQNQVQQETRATVTKEFNVSSLKSAAKKELVIAEGIQLNKKALMDEYQSVQDLATLPDEVLPIMLASKLDNKESADAFEIGLQTVVSTQTLTSTTKGFLLSVFNSFRTQATHSGVPYSSIYLAADTIIVAQTQAWAEENLNEARRIFVVDPKFTRAGAPNSIGEFLLHLRTSVEFSYPKNIQACYSNIETLLGKSEYPETAKTFLEYLSSVMVDLMDAWLLEKCMKHHAKSKPETLENIADMLKTVRAIFLEVRTILPSLSLQDTYSSFLGIVTSKRPPKTDRALWQEFVLLATIIKSNSLLTTIRGQNSHFDLIKAKLLAQKGSLSKLNSNAPGVCGELRILAFVMRYVNLSSEELQKLSSKCDELSCLILKTNQNVFEEFQNFQKSIEGNFREYHLKPIRLRIEQFISQNLQETTRGRALKELDTVFSLFGSAQCSVVSFHFRRKCLEDYEKFLKESRRDDEDFLSELKSSLLEEIEFEEAVEPEETPGSSFGVPESLINVGRGAMNFRKRWTESTETIKVDRIPEIIEMLRQIRKTTSSGYIVGSIPVQELSVISEELLNFFDMNPNFKRICLIEQELQRFQVYVKNKSVRNVHYKVQALVSERKDAMRGLDKKIEAIVQLVRQLIENSNQILHPQEILMSIKMHLVKIVDGLEIVHQESSIIADLLLDEFRGEVTSMSMAFEPKDVIAEVEKMINKVTTDLTESMCASLGYVSMNISDVISPVVKKLEELKQAPPTSDGEFVVFLQTNCDIMSHAGAVDLNVFKDDVHKPDAPKLKEFHTLVQTVLLEKHLWKDSRIAQLMKQLDTLVTAHEASDFSCFFKIILNSRRKKFKDLEDKVAFLIQRSQEDLENILEVSLQSQENSLICEVPFNHYCESASSFISEEFENSNLETCKMKMAQIYLESFLKFPCLQDPKLPTLARNHFSEVGSPGRWNQLLPPILRSLAVVSPNTALIAPVILIAQKMTGANSQDDSNCKEIYSLVHEINQFSSKFQDTRLQDVLEGMVEELKTRSLQICFTIATKGGATEDMEKGKILEKADNCISLITQRRGSLQRNLFRCRLYHIFEGYFLDSTSTQAVTAFYEETILPIIDAKVASTFGSKVPSTNIQEQLISFINSDSNRFYQSHTEILGLVILKYNLNQVEEEFSGVVANQSKSWQPTHEQKIHLRDFIQNNDPKAVPNSNENRLIKIFLKNLSFNERNNPKIPFLSADEQMYLNILIQAVKPSDYARFQETVKQILITNLPSNWGTSLKDLVKDTLFTRFLNLYVPEDFLDQLELANGKKCTELVEQLQAFQNSHKELKNENEMELASRQYDLQSKTDLQLEEKVKEMIRFKHFFNRYFFFKEAEPDMEVFQWLELLDQRCNVCRVPFGDLNDLFYRFTELPAKELSRIVSQAKLFEWMEAILIQIATKNYTTLMNRTANNGADPTDDFSIGKCLETWRDSDSGSAKIKLIGILADAILQEIKSSSVSTTINLNVIRRVVEFIQKVKVSAGLVKALHQSPLTTWTIKARQYQLLDKFDPKTSDAILKFEDKFGSEKTEQLLKVCDGQPPKLIFEFVNNFNSCRWDLDNSLWAEIENCQDFKKLEEKCQAYSKNVKKAKRDMKEIARLMRENPKNSNFSFCLDFRPVSDKEDAPLEDDCPIETDVAAIKEKFNEGSGIVSVIVKESQPSMLKQTLSTMGSYARTAKSKLSALLVGSSAEEFGSPIRTWEADRIQSWVDLILSGDKNERTRVVKEHLHEVLAVIVRAIHLKEKYYPRDTQLVSAWLLIQRSFREMGCLAEIQTGEGKTLIIAIMVIVRVLCGDYVDVITSSPVLAEESLSQVRGYYDLFKVTAATNCDAEAEKDEKVRKERYSNRVIYGDVGSFQRDVLLTDYFDKGITNGRTPEIVFIDEVDSMLLDKGENILYLSHNIPDLRSLWPIFVEIWNAVHAPDVCRGLQEDVVLVTRFIKGRMRKGEIFFPNSLQNFINEKLVVWIQNAFLAMNMKENDPYILSDVNKKGPTIVIMDKDTGVEQVTMNWSNGLHQFIQLKHTDRLTSESLKAVFMSNICYFRKFAGKLFGITGTLGSTTERELLSQCYKVDFFAVPRFQARRCIEDDGFVLQTESGWVSKIQEVVSAQCLKDRAVLIICENVESVDKIANSLRPLHSARVSAYKSSFDEDFRKKKETTPLNCGNILVATNIAGRGTDLKTTTALEKKGGLHVILSYMPSNVRIEEQAFGRTARSGLSGSVQYIVVHDGAEETTVNGLRRERDENESKRLDNFRIKSIPRIEIEEELCQRFFQTLKKVKSLMEEKDPDVEKLHIENLKNKWALWLDSMSERLKLAHVTKEEPILEAFNKFEEEMLSKSAKTSKFESGPVEFLKLGRHYEEKEKISTAKSYYERVIQSEPNYSDVAHFYMAACILKEKPSDMDAKRQAIRHLKASRKLLKKRMNQLMASSKTLQMTDNLRRKDGKGTISNRYEKQVENECELYQVHCGKIDEAIGASITPGMFKNVKFIMEDEECGKIFDILRKNGGIFKNYRLSKKVSFDKEGNIIMDNVTTPWPSMFMYCKPLVVQFLKKSLEDGTRSSRYMEYNAFCEIFKKAVVTRSKFWDFLLQNKVLINAKLEKLLIIRSSAKEKFKNVMVPEELADCQSVMETILERKDTEIYDIDLLEDLCLSQEKLSALEVELALAGVLSSEMVKVADVNPEFTGKLKWNEAGKSWDGFPQEVQEYQALVETIIEAPSGDSSEQPAFEQRIRFEEIPLPIDDLLASQQIWSFLREIGAIKDVCVHFPLNRAQRKSRVKDRLQEIRTALEKEEELKYILYKYHPVLEIRPSVEDVMAVIQGSIGKIKTFPDIKVSYTPLSDYYKTGAYPPELEDFDDQSFGQMLELTEERHWWDWGAFAVAMLGLLQLVGGILLLVFTAGLGAHLGAALISEGVGDIFFAIQAGLFNRNFSWTDYGIHKAMSVAITIATAGIGSWMGHGMEVVGLAGKSAFTLLKIVGKDVLKRAGMTFLDYFAEWGFDKVLSYIRETVVVNCKMTLSSKIEDNNKELFDELRVVMDQVHAESSQNSEAQNIIQETFEDALRNQQTGVVGTNVMMKAMEMTQSVANCLGNCSKLADHEFFANSTNKWVGRVQKAGKIISYIEKSTAFIYAILEMAKYASSILSAFINSLKAALQVMQMRRSERQDSVSEKSRQSGSDFGRFKGQFQKDITTEIISYIATTIEGEFLKPAFHHAARSVVKYFNRRMKRSATKSLRRLNAEKSIKIVTNFQFEVKPTKEQSSSRVTEKVNIRDLDPHTVLHNADLTLSNAVSLFGDDAAFYRDSKGEVYFGKPSLGSCIENFGKGQIASVLELFSCACYFGFTIDVEDLTEELNFKDHKMQIIPVCHGASMKDAKRGFTNVSLVYCRNHKGEARFNPVYRKDEVQELVGELEMRGIGLYQSLIFLKAVHKAGKDLLKSERHCVMKQSCDASTVAKEIANVQKFVRSNLKDFNIAEHLYEKLAQHSSTTIPGKITMESVQTLSLDGVEDGDDGYGYGYILRQMDDKPRDHSVSNTIHL